VKFFFNEVDAELDIKEMLSAVLISAVVVGFPFLLKGILLWIGA
jgi:hypothetical protein